MLVLVAALFTLIPLTLVQSLGSVRIFLAPSWCPIAVYALGVLALGLLDDTLAVEAPGTGGQQRTRLARARRGARCAGQLSTGALKAVGSLGLALLAMSSPGLASASTCRTGAGCSQAGCSCSRRTSSTCSTCVPGARPRRSCCSASASPIGSADLRPLWALGLFAAPALVAGAYDLRERAMLGDTGANLLGALAGLWLVLTLSGTGQLIALALLVAITVYGEFRSISTLIERTPGLRELDSWGRPS